MSSNYSGDDPDEHEATVNYNACSKITGTRRRSCDDCYDQHVQMSSTIRDMGVVSHSRHRAVHRQELCKGWWQRGRAPRGHPLHRQEEKRTHVSSCACGTFGRRCCSFQWIGVQLERVWMDTFPVFVFEGRPPHGGMVSRHF